MIHNFLSEHGYTLQPGATVEWSAIKRDYHVWLAQHGLLLQVARFREQLIEMGCLVGRGPDNRVLVANLAGPNSVVPHWQQVGERVKLVH